jgi:hypothetical protein
MLSFPSEAQTWKTLLSRFSKTVIISAGKSRERLIAKEAWGERSLQQSG